MSATNREPVGLPVFFPCRITTGRVGDVTSKRYDDEMSYDEEHGKKEEGTIQ